MSPRAASPEGCQNGNEAFPESIRPSWAWSAEADCSSSSNRTFAPAVMRRLISPRHQREKFVSARGAEWEGCFQRGGRARGVQHGPDGFAQIFAGDDQMRRKAGRPSRFRTSSDRSIRFLSNPERIGGGGSLRRVAGGRDPAEPWLQGPYRRLRVSRSQLETFKGVRPYGAAAAISLFR